MILPQICQELHQRQENSSVKLLVIWGSDWNTQQPKYSATKLRGERNALCYHQVGADANRFKLLKSLLLVHIAVSRSWTDSPLKSFRFLRDTAIHLVCHSQFEPPHPNFLHVSKPMETRTKFSHGLLILSHHLHWLSGHTHTFYTWPNRHTSRKLWRHSYIESHWPVSHTVFVFQTVQLPNSMRKRENSPGKAPIISNTFALCWQFRNVTSPKWIWFSNTTTE